MIEPFKKPEGDSINNFIVSLVLAIIVFPIIGLLAEGSSYIFNSVGVGFDKILMISTLSGVILVVIMMIIVYYISITSYNRNLDPDNIVIPISTSITDSISSLILISISLLILSIFI